MTGIALPGMGDAGRPAGLPRSDESGVEDSPVVGFVAEESLQTQ